MAISDAQKPEILAPAGDRDCFLAALAAGANGIYLGLKNFSARMEAKNFGLAELAQLIELAHQQDCRVYVAMNNMLKQNELNQAYRLLRRLVTMVLPDGLIVQDLAMVDLARQVDFQGGIAFSTLANVSEPAGLVVAKNLGANRVILPRELSVDEMKTMGEACPEGLELECFVQGALCYCVSGRCYWSSYMGGKSGLRGRCVQPCRRQYSRGESKAGQKRGERLFACQDLELAPTIRALLSVPNLASWKIEGRKKGPHYVYYAVKAYRLLRDNPANAQDRKFAQELLEQALGRPGVRARFLPQKKNQPMAPHGQTSSGLLAGKISILQNGRCELKPHFDLLPKDYLRIGVEDEKWHQTMPVTRHMPKAGSLILNLPKHKTPKAGTPVYLIDRREPELLKLLKEWQTKLAALPVRQVRDVDQSALLPHGIKAQTRFDMNVSERPWFGKKITNKKEASKQDRARKAWDCLWLTARTSEISRTLYNRTAFWLPPAIWPENENAYEALIKRLWQNGARHFVCNAPWQRSLFPSVLPEDADLVAGPFCNLANTLAFSTVQNLGFAAAIISPELPREEILSLPKSSPIPLGVVTSGFWPVGVSRFGMTGISVGDIFTSPRGEAFWSRDRLGLTWIFPAWPLDWQEKQKEMASAGYSFFVHFYDKKPENLVAQKRPGLFNWDGQLL